MSTITYLDGSQLSSTALTNDEFNLVLQAATAQMLGVRIFGEYFTLTSGSNVATPAGMGNLASGQFLMGTGIPDGTTILSLQAPNLTLSQPATVSGPQVIAIGDPSAFAAVRVGWQQEGQPAWGINEDVVFVRASTMDSGYSHMRDVIGSAGADEITQTDVFTRRWRAYWTFYGPSSLDHARAVRSGLIKIPFVADLFAASNLYGNPDIAEPGRNPEKFQGQWWERTDLSAEFNEQITETYTAGIVASVSVSLNTKDGQVEQFTASV